MNANVASFIPKFPRTDSIKDFRQIVVANLRFKIISKILADRLALIASRIASPLRMALSKSRQIKYCISIASEAINMLSKKVKGGNVSYKTDIKKTFNSKMRFSYIGASAV